MDALGHLGLRAFLFFTAFVLSLAPVHAQDDATLILFEPVTGTLASGQTAQWTFTAASGAMLSLHARTLSGDLDPMIAVEDGGGDVIMSNDDYNAPDSHDALLEGVTLPDTGTYTVVVSAFGETSGEYELTLLPGFAAVEYREQFADPALWTGTSDAVEQIFGNNRMALTLSGPQEGNTIVTYQQPVEGTERYIHVEIPEISGGAGWQVGIVARQQDESTYYLYELDYRGQWRFTVNTADGERVIRDWSTHPAIVPGETQFDLGLMLRDSGFEFFYNGQLIGRLTDDALAGPGQIGLMGQLPPGAEGQVTVQFENLVTTVPLTQEPLIPDALATGDSTVTLQELQRRRLIPMTGDFGLIVPESFVMNNRAGVNHIQLGGDQTFTNFALGATVSWEISTPTIPAGCGLTLRMRDENDYLLAYLDQTGAAGLSQRQGDMFEPGVFREGLEASAGLHHLLVVADGDHLLYYADGQLAGTLDHTAVAGAVGNAAVNFEPTTTSCQFNDTWVWTWD